MLRLLLLGPVTGGVVGLASTSAAVLAWLVFGQPDFYFRSWSGVVAQYLMLTIGGAGAGMFYGLGLLTYERLSGCRVQLALLIPVLFASMFAISGMYTAHEFQNHLIDWVAAPEFGVALFGFVLSIATSKRNTIG